MSLATWEKAAREPGVLNLGIGQPALSLLPMELVQQAANDFSHFDARHLLQYGSIAGSGHYLSALASFMSEQTGVEHEQADGIETDGDPRERLGIVVLGRAALDGDVRLEPLAVCELMA